MEIIRPIGNNVGFDKFGQFVIAWYEGDSLCSTFSHDLRDKKCAICGQGWELSGEAYRNHVETGMFRGHDSNHAHRTCWEGHLGLQEADMWHRLLCHPENRDDFLKFQWQPIPNEYRGAWNTPWYRINFLEYVPWLKLGSRKRVYHMGIHDLRPEQIEMFKSLFKDVDSTKEAGSSEAFVHAWTEKEAIKYLSHFAKIIMMDPPRPNTEGALMVELPIKKPAEVANG